MEETVPICHSRVQNTDVLLPRFPEAGLFEHSYEYKT